MSVDICPYIRQSHIHIENDQGTDRCEVHHSVTALRLHEDAIGGGDDLRMECRAIRQQTVIRISLELMHIHGVVWAGHLVAMEEIDWLLMRLHFRGRRAVIYSAQEGSSLSPTGKQCAVR